MDSRLCVLSLYRWKTAQYLLVHDPKPPADAPASPLRVSDTPQGIIIDTGVSKLLIPRPFVGIAAAEYQGQALLKGEGGPSFVDDRGIAWHARHDDKAEIVIEQQGPSQVTIKASGWYQTEEKRDQPFCRFTTRITAFAASPIVKFDHATIFAGDMTRTWHLRAGLQVRGSRGASVRVGRRGRSRRDRDPRRKAGRDQRGELVRPTLGAPVRNAKQRQCRKGRRRLGKQAASQCRMVYAQNGERRVCY